MLPAPLNQTVSMLMRPLPRVFPGASIEAVAETMRETGGPMVAISDGRGIDGIVTEASLVDALSRGANASDPADLAAVPAGQTLRPYCSGAEALHAFAIHPHPAFVVEDDQGRPLGMLTPSDLLPKRDKRPVPARVGGMATPFGVYLTTGNLGAGAGGFALVATGMVLGVLLLLAQVSGHYLANYAYKQGLSVEWSYLLLDAITVVVFFAGMRLLPLAGIHAAEHMVVHALERGEELRPEVVKRMPRVHPRCGTNIAVGAMLFFAIAGATWITSYELRMGLALLATLALWKPLGGVMQYWVTTRKPTEKHIALGIKAGKEMLEKFNRPNQPKRNFFTYIWCSGILHVIAGSMSVVALAGWLDRIFEWGLFKV